MLTSIDAYLHYFEGIHERSLRDILALPPAAAGWAPPAGEGEASWSVDQLVAHIATTRRYFVRAYRGEGWSSPPDPDTSDPAHWPLVIEASAGDVRRALRGTPAAWLERTVPRLGTGEPLAGWQILMFLAEHEIHHRSQIDSYAWLNGWLPPQIYGRSWEDVLALQSAAPSTS